MTWGQTHIEGGLIAILNAFTPLFAVIVAQLTVLGGAFSFALAGMFGRCFKRMGIAPLSTATGRPL